MLEFRLFELITFDFFAWRDESLEEKSPRINAPPAILGIFYLFVLTVHFFARREEFVEEKSPGADAGSPRLFFRVFRSTNVLFLRAPRRFFVGGRGSRRAVK